MTPTTQNKGGRPAHAPTEKDRQMVEVLAGVAIPFEKIAAVVGIDKKTLTKHYAEQLERGSATVEAKLVGNLLRIAGGNDGTAFKACHFLLTSRFGWSAYVPRPAVEALPGKKEMAQAQAETAHEGSDWAELVH